MITWMQKHRRWLIITIWVSTIAFIGAGAVSWGNLSYGSKATSVAKVGDVEISVSELQKEYSQIYAQYQKMFGEKFDEKMAKQLGVEDRAMQTLMQKALLLNLANAYELVATEDEVIDTIQNMDYFKKEGKFDKDTYIKLLKQNRFSIKEFEAGLKKDLTIQKLTKLLSSKVYPAEKDPFNTMLSIADRLEYKVLNADQIKVPLEDKALKAYWELHKNSYMTEPKFTVQTLTTKQTQKTFTPADIERYYNQKSFEFTDANGSIMTLKDAHDQVVEALRDNQTRLTNRKLLKSWKLGKLDTSKQIKTATYTKDAAPFDPSVIAKILTLNEGGFIKSIKSGHDFVAIKLIKRDDKRVMSFTEAKEAMTPDYIKDQKSQLLMQKAEKMLPKFKGSMTNFITVNDALAFGSQLSMEESKEALGQIFRSNTPQGIASLGKEKLLLFNIKEQKLLFKENALNNDITLEKQILNLKEQDRLQALIAKLSQTYKSEKYR